jgi:hypothetical protein
MAVTAWATHPLDVERVRASEARHQPGSVTTEEPARRNSSPLGPRGNNDRPGGSASRATS